MEFLYKKIHDETKVLAQQNIQGKDKKVLLNQRYSKYNNFANQSLSPLSEMLLISLNACNAGELCYF